MVFVIWVWIYFCIYFNLISTAINSRVALSEYEKNFFFKFKKKSIGAGRVNILKPVHSLVKKFDSSIKEQQTKGLKSPWSSGSMLTLKHQGRCLHQKEFKIKLKKLKNCFEYLRSERCHRSYTKATKTTWVKWES